MVRGSLQQARAAFTDITEYVALRQHNGDIFLDGTEDFDAALDGLRVLNRLDTLGYDTGIAEVEESVAKRWKVRGQGWPRNRINEVMGGQSHGSR